MSDHPIRDAQVQAAVQAETTRLLARTGGSGQVCVVFDYKDNEAVKFSLITKGSARLQKAQPK